MQHYNSTTQYTLSNKAYALLTKLRSRRKFNVNQYIQLKCELLNSYMRKSNLKTCVIAVSGGIDSAIVLALCKHASTLANSPILNIIPVCLPATNTYGVVNQTELQVKANELCHALNLSLTTIDMNGDISIINAIETNINEHLKMCGSTWAKGQLIPYARTPVLYYITSLYTDMQEPAIIVGTTNRDEGAYLGYVGKASDGMVDVQLISDLHKSEVYQVAHALNVPESIINAIPTGDMYDNRNDEQVFGASYDAVELFLLLHTIGTIDDYNYLINDTEYNTVFYKNISDLHEYNKHKYNVGSPAVHLNIMPSGIGNGWLPDFSLKYKANMFDIGNVCKPGFISPVPFNDIVAKTFEFNYHRRKLPANNNKVVSTVGSIIKIDNIISEDLNQFLLSIFDRSPKLESNVHGRVTEETYNGSERVSWYSVHLADLLWEYLEENIPQLIVNNGSMQVSEYIDNKIYRAVGINPLMRFIGYKTEGMLVPHYDYPYIDKNYKSMYSLIVYLTNNTTGKTRFHKEDEFPSSFEDWSYNEAIRFNEVCNEEDFIFENTPQKLSILMFPHFMLHDCMPVINETKVIIRTDVMYEEIKFSGN